MIKVFIGGSQSIMKLPGSVAARIDKIVEGEFTVLIGDASGVDACVQKYLAEKAYASVLVFCTGVCRNKKPAVGRRLLPRRALVRKASIFTR